MAVSRNEVRYRSQRGHWALCLRHEDAQPRGIEFGIGGCEPPQLIFRQNASAPIWYVLEQILPRNQPTTSNKMTFLGAVRRLAS